MKIKDLFEELRGSDLELANIDDLHSVNATIPFVSRTEKNNGISAYIPQQGEKTKINPGHSLSVALGSSSVLETFYQESPYYSGRDIGILIPKVAMTKEVMMYYALCIKKNKIKYSYGRQANRTLQDIEIPAMEDVPLWVSQICLGEVTVEDPKEVKPLDQNSFEDIFVFDLFEVKRGKTSKPLVDLLSVDGKIPVISSTDANNGITGFTKDAATFEKLPCLTLAINGSIGACFYQDVAFQATADVAILQPKFELTSNIGLYFATVLRKEGQTKYSYGRKIDKDSLKNTQIRLPTKDGEVQWQVIEDYIESIREKYKIKQPKSLSV